MTDIFLLLAPAPRLGVAFRRKHGAKRPNRQTVGQLELRAVDSAGRFAADDVGELGCIVAG